MLLLKEDFDGLLKAIAILQTICKNAVMSEIEEEQERELSKLLKLGAVNLRRKPLIEEVKELLIKLKIKGSSRVRSNGLIEIRTQQFGSTYGRTVEEIEQKLQAKLDELKTSKRAQKKFILLSEFFKESYLPYKLNQDLADSTIEGIEYNFNFIVSQGFDKPMNVYNPRNIEDFLYSIPRTRKRQIIQGLLNNIFNRAVLLSVVKSNPCEVVEKMKHKAEQGTAFSFQELTEYFKLVFSSDDISHAQKCYYAFVFLTGTRRNEALSCSVSDVDFAGDVLKINGTKTDGSLRYIPLAPLVKKLLLSIEPINGKYFPFSDRTVNKVFTAHKQTLGIKHKLHDLRHSFGTIQICVNKIDIKTVSLWLGHSTIDTTLRIYTHPEQLDRATFLRGGLSDKEKTAILEGESDGVIKLIADYITAHTQNLPKNSD